METSATKVNEDFLYMDIKAEIIDSEGLNRTVTRLAHEVIERNSGTSNMVLKSALAPIEAVIFSHSESTKKLKKSITQNSP